MFRGVELVKRALDECYGVDKVSLVSAAFRWLNHHSKISSQHNGECTLNYEPPSIPPYLLDAIIIGASNKEHLVSNMDACEEGPLDERELPRPSVEDVSLGTRLSYASLHMQVW